MNVVVDDRRKLTLPRPLGAYIWAKPMAASGDRYGCWGRGIAMDFGGGFGFEGCAAVYGWGEVKLSSWVLRYLALLNQFMEVHSKD